MIRRMQKYFLFVFLLALFGVTLSSPAFATSARMHSLNGSAFIDDDTNIFRYAGTLLQFTNKVVFDAEPSSQSGSGGFIWGKKMGVGVFFNRSSRFDDLGETRSLFGLNEAISLPNQLINVVGAFELAPGMSAGVGLSYGTSLKSETNLGTTSRANRTSGVNSHSFEAMFGFSMREDHLKLDASLALTFSTFKLIIGDEIQYQGSLLPSVSIQARGFFRLNHSTEFGFEVTLARRSYQVQAPVHNSVGSYSRWIVEALVGPRITLIGSSKRKSSTTSRPAEAPASEDGDEEDSWDKKPKKNKKRRVYNKPRTGVIKAQIVGGLLLGYEVVGGTTTYGAEGLTESEFVRSASALTLPGFHAAVEAVLGKYITVRMGATARFYLMNSSGQFPKLREPANSEEPSNKGAATTSKTQKVYSWGAGIGFNYNGFRLDGSFEAPLFTQGPNIIGGKSPGLFALASLSYHWK